MKYKQELTQLIKSRVNVMDALACIEKVSTNFWLGGGAIRNLVWDDAHGVESIPKDYDVIHFHKPNCTLKYDLIQYEKLKNIDPNIEWQVVNQYRKVDCQNLIEGVKTWADISSCVIVRKVSEEIEIVAPYGLDILFNLILMPNINLERYMKLINKKKWMQTYPNLKLIKIC